MAQVGQDKEAPQVQRKISGGITKKTWFGQPTIRNSSIAIRASLGIWDLRRRDVLEGRQPSFVLIRDLSGRDYGKPYPREALQTGWRSGDSPVMAFKRRGLWPFGAVAGCEPLC